MKNMKNIIKYIMGAAALLAAASCAKNVNWDEPVPGDGQPGISLQFTNSALTTKATVPGVNQENRVDRIRFFVFPATETQVTEGEGEIEGMPEVPVRELAEMIKSLPDGYRTVFNLFVFEKKSHREIAGLLGIKEDSSASQFFRARAMLAKKIKDYWKKQGYEQ